MSNLPVKYCFKPSLDVKFVDRSAELNVTNQKKLFSDSNTGSETSSVGYKTNPSSFTEMVPRQSSVNSQVNQLFKIPNFDNLPVKKATVKSICSPRRRVQSGRVKNELKPSSKVTLIPRPSFINSRKSLHGSRSSQLNARKELIKKMVYLAECSLKEKVETKPPTPVKVLAGLTPRKTPRSGGYFILPEFNKKLPKLEDIRSPIQQFIKKEVFAHSAKPLPATTVKKIETPEVKPKVESSPIKKLEDEVKPKLKTSPDKGKRFTEILSQCKVYNEEVRLIHEKIKLLDDSFEDKLMSVPDYRVYNEFCFYQMKKEELYKQLQKLEADLRDFMSTHTKVGAKLKAYVKKKQEFFEMQTNLHRDFEQAVQSVVEKFENNKEEEENIAEEETPKVETPKLRRSMRLSKIKKNKLEEWTPMTRRLKKLDSKSKGIQKSGKVRSP